MSDRPSSSWAVAALAMLLLSGCSLRSRPVCVAISVDDKYIFMGTSDRRKVNRDGMAMRRVVLRADPEQKPTWIPEAWMEVGDGPCRTS